MLGGALTDRLTEEVEGPIIRHQAVVMTILPLLHGSVRHLRYHPRQIHL